MGTLRYETELAPVPPLGTDRLVSAQELATYLGVPIGTVYSWRYRREGPPSMRIGRHLRYRWGEVQAWLDNRTMNGASDGGSPAPRPEAKP